MLILFGSLIFESMKFMESMEHKNGAKPLIIAVIDKTDRCSGTKVVMHAHTGSSGLHVRPSTYLWEQFSLLKKDYSDLTMSFQKDKMPVATKIESVLDVFAVEILGNQEFDMILESKNLNDSLVERFKTIFNTIDSHPVVWHVAEPNTHDRLVKILKDNNYQQQVHAS
jgi:hypothetical protein